MKTKSTRRAAAAARTAARRADNVIHLPAANGPSRRYRPTAAPTPTVELRPTGYLLVTQLHKCDCGSEWEHSEFFLVETLPSPSGGAHRRTPASLPLVPGLIVGRSRLLPKRVSVCPSCFNAVAEAQQSTVLPPLDPLRFAETAESIAAPRAAPTSKPRRAPVSLEDIA